jgi:hypothetical protein
VENIPFHRRRRPFPFLVIVVLVVVIASFLGCGRIFRVVYKRRQQQTDLASKLFVVRPQIEPTLCSAKTSAFLRSGGSLLVIAEQ